jgi:hypothetical protein
MQRRLIHQQKPLFLFRPCSVNLQSKGIRWGINRTKPWVNKCGTGKKARHAWCEQPSEKMRRLCTHVYAWIWVTLPMLRLARWPVGWSTVWGQRMWRRSEGSIYRVPSDDCRGSEARPNMPSRTPPGPALLSLRRIEDPYLLWIDRLLTNIKGCSGLSLCSLILKCPAG